MHALHERPLLKTRVPAEFLDINKKAFEIGLNLAEKYFGSLSAV